ncbi:MAG: motility associated factor glycosyltransferase family protein [Rhodobacterales bacterium]|nr:motility associated factor glycosyltransferase family protein [Rhodobacterales bacterium]
MAEPMPGAGGDDVPGGDTLYDRNVAVWRARRPEHWALLEAQGVRVSSRVDGPDGRPVNIDLGGTRLYPSDGPAWTAEQLRQFDGSPDRLGFSDPSHCNLSPVSKRVLFELGHALKDRGLRRLAPYPVVDVGYAFVFGLGLGLHLPDLVARAIARHIVIIEPVPEFILHSMHVLDWADLFRQADAQGLEIHFLGGPGHGPERMVAEIEAVIRARGATFIDGSYAYIHYYSWELGQTRKLLNEKIKTFFISSGFFEDEILMMKNAYGNFRRWPFHLVDRRPYLEQAMPMFVVGSGPSLDQDLAVIRKWRDRALVFSCGTSLGILLKNGIRPDLHVENENTAPLVDNLKAFDAEYGLKGITLVASATVVPELSALFDDVWYFFRAPLSSSQIMHGNTEPLPFADPLVANAAAAVAGTLGFGTVYLFGVDCGMLKDGDHHARDAVYYQEDYDNYVEGESLEFIERGFDREVPGNFGGTVMTSWSLDLSRRTLTALAGFRRLTLINCGHGARIDGARPMAGAAIRLTNPEGQRQAVMERLQAQLKFFEPGAFLERVDLQGALDGCDTFITGFTDMIAQARAEDRGFWELEKRLEAFWEDQVNGGRAVLRIAGGSITSMVRLGAFFGTRVEDPDERAWFLDLFLDHYAEACLWMADEVRTLLAAMVAGEAVPEDIGKRPAPEGLMPAGEPTTREA